jgi:methanogenic corrinoid protein MtbC1
MTGNTPQVADWGRAEDAAGSPPDRASQGTGTQTPPGARLRRLMNAIDSEVIPRLVLAHRDGDRLKPSPRSMNLAAQVENLLALLLADRTDAVIAHLRSLRDEGSSVEAMYLDILAPMARRLGELWLSDQCDFARVTLGMLGVQQAMRHFSLEFRGKPCATLPQQRALLAAMPGEQHTFGVSMLAEFFRRDGWDVVEDLPQSQSDLLDRVRSQPFHVVGLSLSRDAALGALAGTIRAIRRESCHPAVAIMVGGAAFAGHARRAARVGADATALDPRQAVRQARNLLMLLSAER